MPFESSSHFLLVDVAELVLRATGSEGLTRKANLELTRFGGHLIGERSPNTKRDRRMGRSFWWMVRSRSPGLSREFEPTAQTIHGFDAVATDLRPRSGKN